MTLLECCRTTCDKKIKRNQAKYNSFSFLKKKLFSSSAAMSSGKAKQRLKTFISTISNAIQTANVPYQLLDKQNAYKSTGEEASDVEGGAFRDTKKRSDNVYLRTKTTSAAAESMENAETYKVYKMVRELSAASERKFSSLYGKSATDVNWLLIPGFYLILGFFLSTWSLAVKYFAMDVLKIDPGMFGFLYAIVVIPWFMKPLFGLISDKMPFMGRHRSPYIAVCSFLATIVWVLLAVPGAHSRSCTGFGILMILSNVFMCFCDVVVDCMLARQARDEIANYKALVESKPVEAEKMKGRAQSRAWMCRHVGSVMGIVLGGVLVWLRRDNLHIVFAVTAFYPGVLFVGSFFLQEEVDPIYVAINEGNITKNHHRKNGFKARGKLALVSCAPLAVCREISTAFHDVRSNETFMNLAKFILLFSATPNSGLTFSYFLVNKLMFSDFLVAVISVVAVFSMLAGLATYFFFLKKIRTRRLMRISILIGIGLSVLPMLLVTGLNRRLGIADEFFALGDDAVENFTSQLMVMPLMITMAAECPEGQEGLFYSGMLALSNFGGAVSTGFGGLLTHALGITKKNYDKMWLLVLLCAVTNIVPYFFVHWVPESMDNNREEKKIAATPLIIEQEPKAKTAL